MASSIDLSKTHAKGEANRRRRAAEWDERVKAIAARAGIQRSEVRVRQASPEELAALKAQAARHRPAAV